MTKKPLVSIIVPCYNVEKYIEACVSSVLLQDYKNWECILIDDGSKDATYEKLCELQDANEKLKIFTQENAGLSATRNRGMSIAKGEFLFFLDSDDVLATDAISALINADEGNDIITGITVNSSFSENKINKISKLLHPREGAVSFENSNFEVIVRTMEIGLTPVAQNRLYKKDFIDAHQLQFKLGILHEDELWFFETMVVAQNVKFIDKETYFYRIDNQESITKNVGDRNLESYVQVMETLVDKYFQNKQFATIASWYSVYIKKIFLDFAIRERSKLSDDSILRLETALKKCYIALGNEKILGKNNEIYYKTINKLTMQPFTIIEKYFFRNPVNSLRKMLNVLKIANLKIQDAER